MLMLPETASIELVRKAAWKRLADYGIKGYLLGEPSNNLKMDKSAKDAILSAPHNLAPANLSGYNVCAQASKGCKLACLHTAGNPVHQTNKDTARTRRTIAFFEARTAYMICLVHDAEKHAKRAQKLGMKPAIRLNTTSDIRWESIPVTRLGVEYPNIMAAFPDMTFYDYTKLSNRKDVPSNYHLTFSLSENNERKAADICYRGIMSVAVVFDVGRTKPLPTEYRLDGIPFRVIDGDVTDYRPADPLGVIIGLRAKGKARGDKSGFVRSVNV